MPQWVRYPPAAPGEISSTTSLPQGTPRKASYEGTGTHQSSLWTASSSPKTQPLYRGPGSMLHALRKVGRRHRMPFGAELTTHGVRFRLWAPKHEHIHLNIMGGDRHLMRPVGDGWHELLISAARSGSLYQFVLPDGRQVPDPASRF